MQLMCIIILCQDCKICSRGCMKKNKKIKVSICGIHGYVGKVLLKLILNHPQLTLVNILARNAESIDVTTSLINNTQHILVCSVAEFSEKHHGLTDVLFLATPADASIEIVSTLKNSKIKIIDLSGAFRLPIADLEKWYGLSHTLENLITGAPYGLSPFGFQTSNEQQVLANPGCYPTCALLSLIPLLQKNVIKNSNIIIDAKSGTSGAGKKNNPELMYCEMNENFFPYKIGEHQHLPEIKKALAHYTQYNCDITFVTHLLPIHSGIYMTIYADVNDNLQEDNEIARAIGDAFYSAYQNYPLIKYNQIHSGNTEVHKYYLALKNVISTAHTHINYFVYNKKIILFSCIDNLWKGAASQAIENINTLFELPVETGLQ